MFERLGLSDSLKRVRENSFNKKQNA